MTTVLPPPTCLRVCTGKHPTSTAMPLDDWPRVPIIILSWPIEVQTPLTSYIQSLTAMPAKSLAYASRDPSYLNNGPGWVDVAVKIEFESAGERFLLIGEVEVREHQFLSNFLEFFRRRGSFYVVIGGQQEDDAQVFPEWSIVLERFLNIPAGSPAPIDLLK